MRRIFGKEYDIKRVIKGRTGKCARCQQETAACQKLYLRKGNNMTICVELK